MDPATTAALIQGGTTLLGGLLGRDKGPSVNAQRSDMRRTEEERYMWLRKGAKRAGFNPLTVLRSTGGATAPQFTQQTPLSTRAVLGEAIKAFGGTYAQDAIQRATEDRAQEDWKERYDYDLANKPPVSTMPANKPPSRANKIKIGGDRAADYLITEGTLSGRYVLPIGGTYKLAPQGWVPAGLTEDLFAGLAAEVEGVTSNLSHNSWPVVSVAKDGTVRLPEAPEAVNPPLAVDVPVSP